MSLFYKFYLSVNVVFCAIVLFRLAVEWLDDEHTLQEALTILALVMVVANVVFGTVMFGLKFIWGW